MPVPYFNSPKMATCFFRSPKPAFPQAFCTPPVNQSGSNPFLQITADSQPQTHGGTSEQQSNSAENTIGASFKTAQQVSSGGGDGGGVDVAAAVWNLFWF